MAVDMYIKIDGIKGEAQDDKHKGEIDVLAWSWGMSQSGTLHMGGGGGGGKANFQDLSFTKWCDKASPELMLKCASGEHIKDATLFVRKAGGKKPIEYLTYKLTTLIVTSVSAGGSGGEEKLTENVTLNFAKISIDYQEQDDKGAAQGGKINFGWDIPKNKKA